MEVHELDLEALTKEAEKIYQRHLEKRIDWSYHQYIPWHLAEDFTQKPWNPDQVKISPELQLGVETAFLTEANLPWYTHGILDQTPKNFKVFQDFIHTWTSEEDLHANALHSYLLVTRNTNPEQLHQLRKETIVTGWEPKIPTPVSGVCYTAIQELSTQGFYAVLAKKAEAEDPILAKLLRQIGKDETHHYVFYRDFVKAILDQNPNYVEDILALVRNYAMPNHVIPNAKERSRLIAKYFWGTGNEFKEYVSKFYQTLIDAWDLENLKPTKPSAQQAQKRLKKFFEILITLSESNRESGVV